MTIAEAVHLVLRPDAVVVATGGGHVIGATGECTRDRVAHGEGEGVVDQSGVQDIGQLARAHGGEHIMLSFLGVAVSPRSEWDTFTAIGLDENIHAVIPYFGLGMNALTGRIWNRRPIKEH